MTTLAFFGLRAHSHNRRYFDILFLISDTDGQFLIVPFTYLFNQGNRCPVQFAKPSSHTYIQVADPGAGAQYFRRDFPFVTLQIIFL